MGIFVVTPAAILPTKKHPEYIRPADTLHRYGRESIRIIQ